MIIDKCKLVCTLQSLDKVLHRSYIIHSTGPSCSSATPGTCMLSFNMMHVLHVAKVIITFWLAVLFLFVLRQWFLKWCQTLSHKV